MKRAWKCRYDVRHETEAEGMSEYAYISRRTNMKCENIRPVDKLSPEGFCEANVNSPLNMQSEMIGGTLVTVSDRRPSSKWEINLYKKKREYDRMKEMNETKKKDYQEALNHLEYRKSHLHSLIISMDTTNEEIRRLESELGTLCQEANTSEGELLLLHACKKQEIYKRAITELETKFAKEWRAVENLAFNQERELTILQVRFFGDDSNYTELNAAVIAETEKIYNAIATEMRQKSLIISEIARLDDAIKQMESIRTFDRRLKEAELHQDEMLLKETKTQLETLSDHKKQMLSQMEAISRKLELTTNISNDRRSVDEQKLQTEVKCTGRLRYSKNEAHVPYTQAKEKQDNKYETDRCMEGGKSDLEQTSRRDAAANEKENTAPYLPPPAAYEVLFSDDDDDDDDLGAGNQSIWSFSGEYINFPADNCI